MANLPDDYGMHWRTCSKHNFRYHASDGGCDMCIDEAMAKAEPKYGSTVPGCIFVSVNENNEIIYTNVKTHGYLCLIIGRVYGIRKYEDHGFLAASIFDNEQQAIDNDYKLILDTRGFPNVML